MERKKYKICLKNGETIAEFKDGSYRDICIEALREAHDDKIVFESVDEVLVCKLTEKGKKILKILGID